MSVTSKVYQLAGGDLALWHDDGAICIKTKSGFGDPVELAEDEAAELARILLEMVGEPVRK